MGNFARIIPAQVVQVRQAENVAEFMGECRYSVHFCSMVIYFICTSADFVRARVTVEAKSAPHAFIAYVAGVRPNGFDDTRTASADARINEIDEINGLVVIVVIFRKVNFASLEKRIYGLLKSFSCSIVVSVALRFAAVIFPRVGNGDGPIYVKSRAEFAHGICNKEVPDATDVMIFVVSLFIQKVVECGFRVRACKFHIGELDKNNNPANVSFSELEVRSGHSLDSWISESRKTVIQQIFVGSLRQ